MADRWDSETYEAQGRKARLRAPGLCHLVQTRCPGTLPDNAIRIGTSAVAPVAPASRTTLVLLVLTATPKTRPKIGTVPSSMPKTVSPTKAAKGPAIACQMDDEVDAALDALPGVDVADSFCLTIFG